MLGYAVMEGVGFGLLDALRAVQSAGASVGACAWWAAVRAASIGPNCWPRSSSGRSIPCTAAN